MGEAGGDHQGGERVEFGAVGGHLLGHHPAQFGQRAAGQAGIEVVAGLLEGRRRQPGRGLDDAVLHLAVAVDQDDEGAAGPERDEFDVLDGALGLRRQDQAGGGGQARQQGTGLGQRVF